MLIWFFIVIAWIYYYEVDNENKKEKFNVISKSILNNLRLIQKYLYFYY